MGVSREDLSLWPIGLECGFVQELSELSHEHLDPLEKSHCEKQGRGGDNFSAASTVAGRRVFVFISTKKGL